MGEPGRNSSTERTSGRERVRHVVELLEEPTPVQTIADRAEVSRATADDELEHRLTELKEDVNDFGYVPFPASDLDRRRRRFIRSCVVGKTSAASRI